MTDDTATTYVYASDGKQEGEQSDYSPTVSDILLWRIAESLERANELKLRELELAHPDKVIPSTKPPKIARFSVADPAEWNKRWEEERTKRAINSRMRGE